MSALRTGDSNVQEEEIADTVDQPRQPRVSPGLSFLLIGGVAFGGIVCMCLAVIVIAVWTGS